MIMFRINFRHFLGNAIITLNLIADAAYFSGGYFGGSLAIAYLTSLGCYGTENRLFDCRYTPTAHTACGKTGLAGVRCIGIDIASTTFLYYVFH